jgi:hypothetical protein
MRFALFDNRILTTPKCGTRYLQKKYDSVFIDYNEINNFSDIEFIIIREPIEHLKSALHTEFFIHSDLYNYDITDLKIYLDKLILKEKNMHWSYNMYEIIYWIYLKNNKKIKIIHLSSLTDFIKKEGYEIKYEKSDYDWHTNDKWINKDDFFNKLLEEFPTQMQILLKQSNKQTVLYNKIINNKKQTKLLI